jgi:hypothetical protein
VASLPKDWDGPAHASQARAILVGGCQRSGTTLTRTILGRHPNLAAGPETGFFWRRIDIAQLAVAWDRDPAEIAAQLRASRSLPDFAEVFFRPIMERFGKARFVEKTPANVRAISKLLSLYPEGRFIHVVRDGRDVACSLRTFHGARVDAGQLRVPDNPDNPIRGSAEHWVLETSYGLAYRGHPRCLEVRYEALVGDTEAEIARICAFIGETPHPAMLRAAAPGEAAGGGFVNNPNAPGPIDPDRAGRWRRDLSLEERATVAHVAGGLLRVLNYAHDDRWVTE